MLKDLERHAANVRLARGWNDRPRGVRAQLKAIQLEIVRMQEQAPRIIPNPLVPKGRPSHSHPCPRCGRPQPDGQSPEAIASYVRAEPAAVMYVRADGCVRFHDVGCDALPAVPKPPVEPDGVEYIDRRSPNNAGLSATPAPRPKWADNICRIRRRARK